MLLLFDVLCALLIVNVFLCLFLFFIIFVLSFWIRFRGSLTFLLLFGLDLLFFDRFWSGNHFDQVVLLSKFLSQTEHLVVLLI